MTTAQTAETQARYAACSSRRVGLLALEPLEERAQRSDFGFQHGDALHHLVGRRLGVAGVALLGRDEGKPDLVIAPPLHLGAKGLVALRDVEVEHVGQRHGIGEDDARALLGHVADQARQRAALAADIDVTAQEALGPSGIAAFAHRSPSASSYGQFTPQPLMAILPRETLKTLPISKGERKPEVDANTAREPPLPGRNQPLDIIDESPDRAGRQARDRRARARSPTPPVERADNMGLIEMGLVEMRSGKLSHDRHPCRPVHRSRRRCTPAAAWAAALNAHLP